MLRQTHGIVDHGRAHVDNDRHAAGRPRHDRFGHEDPFLNRLERAFAGAAAHVEAADPFAELIIHKLAQHSHVDVIV